MSSIITFLCNLYFIIKKLQRIESHSTRFSTLFSFFNFMAKVEREARRLISTELNNAKGALLKSKRVSALEMKRRYLADDAKKHPSFTKCVKCGHPPLAWEESNTSPPNAVCDETVGDGQVFTSARDRYVDADDPFIPLTLSVHVVYIV